MKRYIYDYDPNEETRWYRRLIVRVGRTAEQLRARARMLMLGILFLFACYCIISYARGGTVVDLALVDSPYNVARYRWHDNIRDSKVSRSTVDARRGLAHANLLTLVASSDSDLTESMPIQCRDLLSRNAETARFYNEMFDDADTYLRANVNNGSLCVCAPMLGKAVRYIALAARLHDRQNEEDNLHIEHAINPSDEHAAQYKALDAAFFERNNIDLSIENESQNYRYNEPRGTFSVLRRQKVVLTLVDKACNKQKMTVSGELALCTQQCFDLIDGIDVRYRARMQWMHQGVRLNEAEFVTFNPATRDEL